MFTFTDVWSYTIPTQAHAEKTGWKVTRPEVLEKIAAFFVKKDGKKIMVELVDMEDRTMELYINGICKGYATAKTIRMNLLDTVKVAIRQKNFAL